MVMSSSMIVLPKGVRSRSARVRLEGKLSRRFGSCWKLASGEKCDAPRQLTCVMFYPGIEKCCGKRFELWGGGLEWGVTLALLPRFFRHDPQSLRELQRFFVKCR
jgi:hypothetical protein